MTVFTAEDIIKYIPKTVKKYSYHINFYEKIFI